MQSNNKVIFGIIAVVIIGGWFVFSSQDETNEHAQTAMMEEGAMMEGDEAEWTKEEMDAMMEEDGAGAMMESSDAMMSEDAMMTHGGTYESYSAEKLAYADTGNVVLFFKASWCPSCRAADKDIKANLSAIPSDLTILELDYDKETALKQKYKVTTQHTFVQVDTQGNLIKKWTGSPTLAAVVTEVQ